MAVKVKDASGKIAKIAGRGAKGEDGTSAYDYAVAGGYTGTEAEFQTLMGSGPWVKDAYEEFDVPITNPSFAANSGWGGFKCRKLSDGTVILRINVMCADKSTPVTTAQTIGILPEGYRPARDGVCCWVAFSQDVPGMLQGVVVSGDGCVNLRPVVGNGYVYSVSTGSFAARM